MKPLDPMKAPVLRTLPGCRQRVRLMSLGDVWRLAYRWSIYPEDLPRELYHRQRKGKK